MIEFILSGLVWYFTNFNYGLTTLVFLKSLFNKSYKTSLFMIFNFLIYSTLGPSYILFAKLYLISTIIIFLHDKIKYLIQSKEDLELEKHGLKNIGFFENVFSKISEFYNFINLVISIPFYILYDNLSALFQEVGITKIIQDNKYYKKIKESYSIVNEIKNFDKIDNISNIGNFEEFKKNMPKLPNISDFSKLEDEELEDLLDEMLNPNKFLNMTNNMRENIGKKPLTQNDLKNKMDNFENLFGMFDINKMLKDFENEEKSKKLQK